MVAIDVLSRHLNKAVDALFQIAPKRLDEIAGRDDGIYADLLKPNQGATLGGGQPKLAAEVWAEALSAAVAKVNDAIEASVRKLKSAARIELATSIGAALSGSTLIALLSGGSDSKPSQLIVAAIGLACSVASTITAAMRRTYLGANRIDQVSEATKTAAEATVVALHLRSLSTGTSPDDQLIARAETLLQKLLATVI
jgi:hypothetical protein